MILENVDRLICSPAKQCGRDFSIILRCFYQNGYAVEWRVINAADYGQAQRRRRILIVAYHNRTKLFQDLAESVCHKGLKAMHKQVVEKGIMSQAFPIASHQRNFVDHWIDEIRFEDMGSLSEMQKVYLYNAGVMMNGRIYSVEVIQEYEPFIPLKMILEQGAVDERYFLRDEDMPKWKYDKGAKNEQRSRRDGII